MAGENRNILFVSEDNCLLTLNTVSWEINKLIDIDYKSHRGCSFSPPIKNRIVYLVGGSSLDVYYYDLRSFRGVLRPGPSICLKTWQPVLILLGSKLFAFEKGDGFWGKPKCQFLDTDSVPLQWCVLQTSPVLPKPPPEDFTCYSVVSYAVNTNSNDIFLSLGVDTNSLAYCYNDAKESWSNFSETPLPFFGQGKFVGLHCYGFPKTYGRIDHSWYLSKYILTIDWDTHAEVSCIELNRYSLLHNYPDPYIPSYLYSVFPTADQNQLALVRGTQSQVYMIGKVLNLEVSTIHLQNHHREIPIYLRLNPTPPPDFLPVDSPPFSLPQPLVGSSSGSSGVSEPDPSLFFTQVSNYISIPLSYALREILGEYN